VTSTPGATPAATSTPAPIATPTAFPNLTLPPLLTSQGGLLFNSVESVLESYLID
jgi:hypothetical protein